MARQIGLPFVTAPNKFEALSANDAEAELSGVLKRPWLPAMVSMASAAEWVRLERQARFVPFSNGSYRFFAEAQGIRGLLVAQTPRSRSRNMALRKACRAQPMSCVNDCPSKRLYRRLNT